MSTMSSNLDALFPAPSFPPSHLSPQRLPGANLESLAALQHVLKDNHERHHIFFNEVQFHNHVTHRALAIYALGGTGAIIRDYYKRDSIFQRPAFQSPEPITEANFVDHLSDERFYSGYVAFFSEQVSQKGAAKTLEEFVFSEKYNLREGGDPKTQPQMLSRFFEGVVHPLIHAGYGVEFGLKGMVIEGLALAAVQTLHLAFSPAIFASSAADPVENIVNHFSGLALDAPAATDALFAPKAGVHAFDIAARILKDDRLRTREPPVDLSAQFRKSAIEHIPLIKEYAAQWTVDLSQPGEIERKTEELVWLSSLVYGVGGLRTNGHQSDFLLMHLVTSSLFLPSLIAYLSPRSQVLILRGYLLTVLTWWAMRGRPALNIKSFMKTTPIEPSVPITPAPGTPLTTETTPTPNPFLPVLQSAIAHPFDHVIKIQRAFAHFDTLYGRNPAGYFKGTELEDAELLDGSLFLRASLLTADYVGWAREGQGAQQFSFKGFYE